VQLELSNEELENELRNLQFVHQDLELKFDAQIEEIDMLQSEIDEQKSHNEEVIERLN
jgi:FtsZ-binding cell division protein ZapB